MRGPASGGPAPTGWGAPPAGPDPYAATPSDPLHGWPPPRPASWLSVRSATGADWAIVLLGPGSAVLFLLARSMVATEEIGDALAGVLVFLCASIAGLLAVLLFFVRLFAKPFPPWIGMLLASAAGTTVWVVYGLVPLIASGRITFSA